jgi:hypothetical protein
VSDPVEERDDLRLGPESIEAIARRLAELLASAEAQQPRERLISAEEVSEWWGVSRRWVYDHADELGAHRLGAGRRPRLRFDPEAVAAYLGAELWSVGKQENGRGGAQTPPDPAPVLAAQ